MKTNLLKGLLAGALAAAAPAAAQTPRLGWEWAQALGRPGSGGLEDTGLKNVVATADGGALVGGQFTGYVVLGPYAGDTLRAAGTTAGMVVKYTAAGRRQWAAAIGGTPRSTERIWPTVVACNRRQQVLALTEHDGPVPYPGGGGTAPGQGVVWSRYDSTGALQQAGELGRGSFECVYLEADTARSFAVSGEVYGPSTLGPLNFGATGASDYVSYVAKINAAGAPLWLRELVVLRSSTTSWSGTRIGGQTVLPNGDVVVSGYFRGVLTVDATHRLTASGSAAEFYLVCYNGQTGAVRWARTAPVYVRVAADQVSGQVYIAGKVNGLLALDQFGITASVDNLFVARLDPVTGTVTGILLNDGGPTAQSFGGIVGQPGGGVALWASGDRGASFGIDFAVPAPAPGVYPYVAYVLQVDAQGGVQALYQTPCVGKVAVDPNGRPYCMANSFGPARFGQLPVIPSRGSEQGLLAHIGLVVLGTKPVTSEAAAATLALHPNPAGAGGAVQVRSTWSAARLQLYDGLGRVVWAGTLAHGQAQVPTSQLPPGLYVLRASDGTRTATSKLLIE